MKLIDKDALVAEIERRKKELIELSNDFANQWACGSLDNILSFLDTLEMKEVDLEKEIEKYLDTNDIEFSHQIKLFDFAKHFFELGLKAKEK